VVKRRGQIDRGGGSTTGLHSTKRQYSTEAKTRASLAKQQWLFAIGSTSNIAILTLKNVFTNYVRKSNGEKEENI